MTEKKKILVLGAGISGHTAVMSLKRLLGDKAEISVVSPELNYNWLPSNIWVGVNQMSEEEVLVPLVPVYNKQRINFYPGRAIELYPEGTQEKPSSFVVYESTEEGRAGERVIIEYDFLINATGPKLNYEATPGLGPSGYTFSVCTASHAKECGKEISKIIEKMKTGIRCTLVIGTGHGTCTCEGAAFEFVFNVDAELRRQNVRDKAKLIYLTNEAMVGDFGVDGINLDYGGFIVPSKIMAESLFHEKDIVCITGAHVENIQKNKISYLSLDGSHSDLDFDFAMLLPPFKGHLLKTFNKNGEDISDQLFNANHFMKVDADYNKKNYDEWRPGDWPKSYQSPYYENIFAVGIAFAPPHPISVPRSAPDGTSITPSPPRTGMPSSVMGKIIAENISKIILEGKLGQKTASMAELGAACIASIGTGFKEGAAVSITMYPIIPNYQKYPEVGRDTKFTFGEVGRSGHWIKKMLHYMFIYKARGKKLWWIIPE